MRLEIVCGKEGRKGGWKVGQSQPAQEPKPSESP